MESRIVWQELRSVWKEPWTVRKEVRTVRERLDHLCLGPQIIRSMPRYHHAGTPPIELFPQKEWLGLGLEMV